MSWLSDAMSVVAVHVADRPPVHAAAVGFMTGIDVKTKAIVWMHRNGTIRDGAPVPIPIPMGVPGLGARGMNVGSNELPNTVMTRISGFKLDTGGRGRGSAAAPICGRSNPVRHRRQE